MPVVVSMVLRKAGKARIPLLAAALARDPQAAVAFDRVAFTHRKEFARWIAEAKRDETRHRRVEQALEMIRGARTRS